MTEEQQLNDLLNEVDNLRGLEIDEVIYQVKSIINLRNIVCQTDMNSKVCHKFKMGDLVIDMKDNEIGFVVGPIYLSSDDDNLKFYNAFKKVISKSINDKKKRYLLVTLGEVIDNESGNPKTGTYRVRYVKEKYITRLDFINKNNNKPDNLSDLEKYCKYQCLLECSSNCYLYKYKKQE